MSGSLLNNPLVVYNWNPTVQLAGFISAELAVEAGVPGATATIIGVGDSTTAGYGNVIVGFRTMDAYTTFLTSTLLSDGFAAQDNNFLGDANFATSDTRVSVVASDWSTTIDDAGAEVIVTTAGDGGVTFTPSSTPTTFNQVSVDYVDLGDGTADVAVDGQQIGAVTFTGTGLTKTATFDVPVGAYDNVSVTAASSTPVTIEGISTYDTLSPAIQVYNAGWSGADTEVLLAGSDGADVAAGYGEAQGVEELGTKLALINFGINDFNFGVPVDMAAADEENFALALRSEGTDPILVIPNPVDVPGWDTFVAEFRADLYAFSTEYDIPVIDLSATYDDDGAEIVAQNLTEDGEHPGVSLYAAIGDNIGSLLAEAIPVVNEPSSVQTVISALGPPTATPQTTAENYSVTGLPSAGGDSFAEQADGDADIGIWTAVGNAAGPATPVTINLGQTYYRVDVLDPALGSNPIDTFFDVASISLTVSDPLVIQVNPTTFTSYADTAATAGGSGSNVLTLEIAEDSYQTNAHFTVDINGAQVGGVFTASAAHSQGQAQAFALYGNFGPTAAVTVNFLDPSLDVQDVNGQFLAEKMLYVESDTYNGVTTPLNLSTYWNPLSLTATTPASDAGTVVVGGSGPDTLALTMNEDQFNGDAQFTISVDGVQVGGVETTQATRAGAETQQFDVLGNFSGAHTVTVDFLNDAYAVNSSGQLTGDRNLFVQSATVDGAEVANSTLGLYAGGPQSFAFTSSTTAAVTPATLNMSEDAYAGDAQFVYSVDGGAYTQPGSVVASHAAGQTQSFALPELTAGTHSLTVIFINDAYASPAQDRNLYVDSIQLGGTNVANSSAALLSDGPASFTFTVPAHS